MTLILADPNFKFDSILETDFNLNRVT